MSQHHQQLTLPINWQRILLRALGRTVLAIMTSVAVTATAGAEGPQGEEGRQVFSSQCSACHTIGGGDRVGPDLLGVTERRETGWLRVHIPTPSIHRSQGDPAALALVEKHAMAMPDLRLPEEQVEAVITYLTTTETAGATPALYVPTLIAGALAVVALTLIGLFAGATKVEVKQ